MSEKLEEFFKENPELMLEVKDSLNNEEKLTIACKCHCGSRSSTSSSLN